MEEKQFTLRSFFIGLIGLVVITASSMYVALKMGALPWPTVFVTIVSFALLNLFRKKPTLYEVNVTHTFMSAGAMVAGGLAFTIPGFWMADPDGVFPVSDMIVLTICAGVLGVIFTSIFREEMIEKKKLSYPFGQAAYDTLIASSKGGGAAKVLFGAMAFSVVFTALRDGALVIPAIITLIPATALTAAFTMYASPMALAIGSIIGPVLAFVWFGGALFAYYIMVPFGIKLGLFADFFSADLFRQGIGIGLMIGTGVGVALKIIISKLIHIKSIKGGIKIDWRKTGSLAAVLIVMVVLLSVFAHITILQGVLLIIGVALTSYLSSTLTGQTGINPMEIFGILVFLGISAVTETSLASAFAIAAVTAVACGLAGDMMNDLKSGNMLGTSPKAQIMAEAIGAVVGAVVAVLVLMVLKRSYGFNNAQLPAPQAAAVSAMAGGNVDKIALIIGVLLGVSLFFLKVPAVTLGLGVYLPIYISTVVGLGALCKIGVSLLSKNKESANTKTGLISSGLLGGEGVTGVLIAIISIIMV